MTRTLAIFLTVGLLQPQNLFAKSRAGRIDQMDVNDGVTATTVTIRGSALGKCQPVLVRDPQGVRSPTLLLPFTGTGISEKVQSIHAAKGSVLSVDIVPLSTDENPMTQILITLAADAPYTLQRNANKVVVIVQKTAEVTSPEPTLIDESAGVLKYKHQEIQPGDMLYVSVSPAEELSRDLAVDQDGKIFIPIIGAVDASGLSSNVLAQRLTTLLSKYVTNPKVDVLIKQFSAQQISVMGQVRQPGSYPYRPNLRLLDIISMAGGFGPTGNKSQIHIYRGSGASRKVTIVDVQEALKTGDITKDFLLQPGDLIDVPKGINPLTIFGDVPRGGNYDYFKDMRLLDLVSLCGGFNESANFKKIKIFRGEAPHQTVITVRFDNVIEGKLEENVLLLPGDSVYVPKRSLWTYSAVANTFVPFTTIILAASTIALVLRK